MKERVSLSRPYYKLFCRYADLAGNYIQNVFHNFHIIAQFAINKEYYISNLDQTI